MLDGECHVCLIGPFSFVYLICLLFFSAVVDGSGVLCDPDGIDRTELRRLAHNRFMISQFDLSKLSPKGFRVLVDQQNVKLPSKLIDISRRIHLFSIHSRC